VTTTGTVVLVLGLVATVVVVAVAGWWAVRRALAAYREATRAVQRLQPALERLDRDAAVTRRELERIGAAMDELERQRQARRDPGRIHPGPRTPRG
jgi:hypothetical protein